MAKNIMVSVRDIKLGAFAQPFFVANEDVAKRSFALAINDKRNENLYPIRDDLELWMLASYDNDSGRVDTKGMPKIIVNRGEMVKREDTNEI